ncbi:MAG: phage portal protein [Alphaproteobacteria bacterium]
MGLIATLRSLVARRRAAEPRDPDEARVPWVGRTQAGVYVNADLALRNATVWACCRYLSQSVGSMPWRVLREISGGGHEGQPTHPVDWLLHREPNPEWSPLQFRETLIVWALMRGNGYAEIERDRAGRPFALWPIHPDRVEPIRTNAGRLAYEVDNDNAAKVVVPREDMFHIRGFGDGPVGVSVIHYAAQSIGWAQAAELFGASFFGQGMTTGGVVEVPHGMTPEAKRRLREELEQRHRGPYRAHRMAILDAGSKWHDNSVDPNEAQFVQTLQHLVEDICRWFGVPPHKVMHLLRATFSNIEHQAIEVVVDSVMPWVIRFEQEANARLFGQNRPGFITKMNMNALLRGDSKSRMEFYQGLRNMGVLSTDEIRLFEDMNPLGGEEGMLRVMQEQYAPLARIIAPPADPAPPAPAADDGDDALVEDDEAIEAERRYREILGQVPAHA